MRSQTIWRRIGADSFHARPCPGVLKITDFVLWLLDQGHAVRVLMGDTSYWHAVDDVVARVATAKLRLVKSSLCADPISSLHDLMRQIAQTDIVVATRFHNVVCALRLGKPVVSIGYAEKNDVLMAEMGLGRFCQHIEHLRVELLIEQFKRLIADRQNHKQSVRNKTLVYQERLDHQDALLAARLL